MISLTFLKKYNFTGILSVFILFILLFLLPFLIFSYGPKTHSRYLTQRAINSLVNNYPFYRAHLGDIKKGSIKEDYPITRAAYHGYNPKTGGGFLGYFNAITYAKGLLSWPPFLLYKISKENYEENKKDFYHRLGRLCHLIEDMASPAHVHEDSHMPWDKDDYEKYCETNYSSVILNSITEEKNLEISLSGSNIWERVMKALAWKTYKASSFKAKLDGANPQPKAN